jgi:hypothetical protein
MRIPHRFIRNLAENGTRRRTTPSRDSGLDLFAPRHMYDM